MNFFFECPTCGTYPVDRQTFEAVLAPDLKDRLGQRIVSDIGVRPIVRFKKDCVKCNPDSEYDISLEVETRVEEE